MRCSSSPVPAAIAGATGAPRRGCRWSSSPCRVAGFSVHAAFGGLRSTAETLAACAAALAVVAAAGDRSPGFGVVVALLAIAVICAVLARLAPTTVAWPLAGWVALQLAALRALPQIPSGGHVVLFLTVALVGLGIQLGGRRLLGPGGPGHDRALVVRGRRHRDGDGVDGRRRGTAVRGGPGRRRGGRAAAGAAAPGPRRADGAAVRRPRAGRRGGRRGRLGRRRGSRHRGRHRLRIRRGAGRDDRPRVPRRRVPDVPLGRGRRRRRGRRDHAGQAGVRRALVEPWRSCCCSRHCRPWSWRGCGRRSGRPRCPRPPAASRAPRCARCLRTFSRGNGRRPADRAVRRGPLVTAAVLAGDARRPTVVAAAATAAAAVAVVALDRDLTALAVVLAGQGAIALGWGVWTALPDPGRPPSAAWRIGALQLTVAAEVAAFDSGRPDPRGVLAAHRRRAAAGRRPAAGARPFLAGLGPGAAGGRGAVGAARRPDARKRRGRSLSWRSPRGSWWPPASPGCARRC